MEGEFQQNPKKDGKTLTEWPNRLKSINKKNTNFDLDNTIRNKQNNYMRYTEYIPFMWALSSKLSDIFINRATV